jgi:hypothetical protein
MNRWRALLLLFVLVLPLGFVRLGTPAATSRPAAPPPRAAASRTEQMAGATVRAVLDKAAAHLPPTLRETLAGKPSPWIVKAHDVGPPTDIHKDIPWHLLDKEKDPRFRLPHRGKLGLFNTNADISWLIGLGIDGQEVGYNPPRRYTDHLANLAAQEIDLGEVRADVLFMPVTSDAAIAVVDCENHGPRPHHLQLESLFTRPAGENKPAIEEAAAAWSKETGKYGYGITVTTGTVRDSTVAGQAAVIRYEEVNTGGASLLCTLVCNSPALSPTTQHPALGQAATQSGGIVLAPGARSQVVFAINLHRYGPKRTETRNQIVLYPEESDGRAREYSLKAATTALDADWRSLAAESFRWYERMPVLNLPRAGWSADACTAMELPRGNTWSPQGVLTSPWYTFCRVHGHEPYGWWSYGMHGHEHLSTFVANLVQPALSQAYLRGHFRLQAGDGSFQYGVNHSGRNIHEPLVTAPLLATEAWTAYGWSGDQAFLREAYACCTRSVEWWRSPARTRSAASQPHGDTDRLVGLQHWYDYIETVRDDKDLATWAATGKAERQEALDLNCYLLSEEQSLAAMARELKDPAGAARWQAAADRRTDTMRRLLWHPEDGVYYGRDLASDRWARVQDLSTFLPLWCGLATPEQAGSIARLLHNPQAFGTDYPIATLAVRDMPQNMRGHYHWRGANWVEMTWLPIQGLRRYGRYEEAARLAEVNARMVFATLEETGHFREFYDSLTGRPSDLTDYIWSSMPAIMLVETCFGIRPRADGLEILPALPAGWPEIGLNNLHVRNRTIALYVRRDPKASRTTVLVNDAARPALQDRGIFLAWDSIPPACAVTIIQPERIVESHGQ